MIQCILTRLNHKTGKRNVLVRIGNCLLDLIDQVKGKTDGLIFRFLAIAF